MNVENAERAAGPVVRATTREQRAMAAIVLQGEEADEEAGRGDGQQQPEPVAIRDGDGGSRPQQGEGDHRDGDLDRASGGARLAIACKDLRPAASVLIGACPRTLCDRPGRDRNVHVISQPSLSRRCARTAGL